MTSNRTLSFEAVAWAVVLILAGYLRFQSLGVRALDAAESREALAAAEGTPQSSVFWDSERELAATSPLYHVLTRSIFTIGGSGEAAARIIPAVAGFLTVVMILGLRSTIGRLFAIILALVVSLSPSWVAVSRTAGGTSLAVAAMVAAAFFATRAASGRAWAARAAIGICLGLGLASGPAFLSGALGLSVVWIVGRRLATSSASSLPLPSFSRSEWGDIALWCVGSAAASASGLGIVPSGLAVLASGWRSWLLGWVQPGLLPFGTALLLLVAYEPLATLLGLADALRASRRGDVVGRWLGIWAAAAVIIFLARVGRTSEDLLWPLIPLSLAASRWVRRELMTLDRVASPVVAAALALVLLVISGFAYLQMSAYAGGIGPAVDASQPALRLPIVAAAIGVGMVIVILVGMGWDWMAARAGAMTTVMLVLLASVVSTAWSLNVSGDPDTEVELWRPGQSATGLARLRKTLQSLAYFETGTRTMPLATRPNLPPDVAWALRGFTDFIPADVGPESAPPAILIGESEPLPALPAEYLGQSVTSEHVWGWEGPWPPSLVQWWLRRSAPIQSTHWVLYVREDIATLTRPEAETP
ncbi:MAG TPA: glycosyltransferase family 39 protein [Anaerolineales bacterium]|nr:glycosyltransferase family 39 protein [Anaerolineales bacterium]